MSGARFGTAWGVNCRPGLKLHISPIVVASLLLFGGVEFAWSDEKIGGAEIVINNVQGRPSDGEPSPCGARR